MEVHVDAMSGEIIDVEQEGTRNGKKQ